MIYKSGEIPRGFELFLFLGNASIDLLSDVLQFEVGTSGLGLLLFQGALGLFQRCLKLFLFQFQTTSDLVHLVNVTPALAELVGEVVNLVCTSTTAAIKQQQQQQVAIATTTPVRTDWLLR